jgi:putative transposase
MAAGSLIDVVQQAVDITGMTDVPVEDRTVLLSDSGPGYLSQQFNEYLRLVMIRHIIASPYHPQTNSKIERYRRYHEGLSDVTPYDVYTGKHVEILQRRKEAKSKTLKARRDYNRAIREQGSGL